MLRRYLALSCAAAFLPIMAFAENPFDGTWRIDYSKTELDPKPRKFQVLNGVYSCSTCVPKVSIKADGADQKVEGYPRFNTLSVRQIDDRAVEFIEKQDGKLSQKYVRKVDASGKKLVAEGTRYPDNAKPETFTTGYARVESGPPGSHAISGAWRREEIGGSSMTMTIKSTPDGGIAYTSWDGFSYTAKFDEKEHPAKGSPTADTVALKRVDANTFEESDRKGGKLVDVTRMAISADGRTMTIVDHNQVTGTKNTYTAVKQ